MSSSLKKLFNLVNFNRSGTIAQSEGSLHLIVEARSCCQLSPVPLQFCTRSMKFIYLLLFSRQVLNSAAGQEPLIVLYLGSPLCIELLRHLHLFGFHIWKVIFNLRVFLLLFLTSRFGCAKDGHASLYDGWIQGLRQIVWSSWSFISLITIALFFDNLFGFSGWTIFYEFLHHRHSQL